MDNGTDFTVEHLAKGSILNAHSFVVLRTMPISARFAVNTTYYTLTAQRFGDIAAEYPPLRKIYNNIYSAALAARDRNENALDYASSRNVFEGSRGAETLTPTQATNANNTLRNLKNAVMYYIAQNRKERKMPKLKDVLE